MKLFELNPKKNTAQAMVEFAIVLPLLLLLLYGLLEAGRLLFIYSTIVTASRQAARYGSATGQGGDYTSEGGPDNSTFARYQDCYGIKRAAQRVDFLNSFGDDDIVITFDDGPGTAGVDPSTDPPAVPPWKDICDGLGDSTVAPSASNITRIVVTIRGDYLPIIPRIVPFIARTRAGGNPVRAISARTILTGVPIEVTPPPGPGPIGGSSGLSLSILAQPLTYASVGEQITYTFTITNNDTTDVTGPFSIIGPAFAVDCSAATSPLAPGAITTCTGTYFITQADIDAGSFVTTATATGTASDGNLIASDPPSTSTITYAVQPGLALTKTVSTSLATVGDTVTYTFTLANSGNVPLTAATISDPQLGGTVAGCGGDLAVGASTTCTAAYTVNSSHIVNNQIINTATATATFGSQTVTATASSTIDIFAGSLFLTVSVSPASMSAPGTVTYTYTLKNNTLGTLYPDGNAGYAITGGRGTNDCSSNTSTIAAGASITCTGTYSVTQADIDAGADLENLSITATACATSNQCNGSNAVPSNTAGATVDIITSPSFTIQFKSVSPNPAPTLGQVITYTYTLTNTSNVTLTPTISGTKVDTKTCAALAPGAVQDCTATYTVTQADLDAGSITSQATATAIFLGQPVSAVAPPVTVVTFVGPRLRLQITPNPVTYPETGQMILFGFTLTNTGTVPLNGPYSVNVSSASGGTISVDCSNASSPLVSGASTSCIGSANVSGVPGSKTVYSGTARASDGTQMITSNTATATLSNPVLGCNTITSALSVPGNTPTMLFTINNPNSYSVTISNIVVAWNATRGHQGGNDQTLQLQRVGFSGAANPFWSGPAISTSPATISPTAVTIPPGSSTIVFTFSQTYNRTDGTEAVTVNLSTAGCETSPIQQPPPPAP